MDTKQLRWGGLALKWIYFCMGYFVQSSIENGGYRGEISLAVNYTLNKHQEIALQN